MIIKLQLSNESITNKNKTNILPRPIRPLLVAKMVID